MDKSESIKELALALAKAQGEFEGALKDTANPFFKSKYADLASCVAAIKPHIAKHGLSYIQISHDADKQVGIETIILHQSGEWLSSGVVRVPVSKEDAQGYGSAMTYARRYSLSSAFGIAPEDDDGNAAAKAAPKPEQKTSLPKCDAETFSNRMVTWQKAVDDGKATSTGILTKAKTVYTLTGEQAHAIASMVKTVEGEVITEADFLADLAREQQMEDAQNVDH